MKVTADTQIQDAYIAQRMLDYLERHDKSADAQVLNETVQRIRQVVIRDLMQPRDTRAGKESNTLYTGPCARKSRLTYDGAPRDPLRARSVLKFLLGDLVELSTLAIARLAGCHIEDNNLDLTLTGEDGILVPVHPDGRYVAQDGTHFNIEIKSCDSKTFDTWLAQGGPDDTWGYLTQASIEIAAWREAGYTMDATIFLAVSTGSRQGSLAEFVMPYRQDLVDAWHERRAQARAPHVPEIPFPASPETKFLRGKQLDAEWMAHGEPTARTNEKGAVYGWDVFTGRQIVPLVCSYCDFRAHHCWQTAAMELDGTKPIWIVPTPGGPAPSQDLPPSGTVEGASALAAAPSTESLP